MFPGRVMHCWVRSLTRLSQAGPPWGEARDCSDDSKGYCQIPGLVGPQAMLCDSMGLLARL